MCPLLKEIERETPLINICLTQKNVANIWKGQEFDDILSFVYSLVVQVLYQEWIIICAFIHKCIRSHTT